MMLPEITIDDGLRPQTQAVSQSVHEETEIKAFLWPFEKNTEPKTLQEIGFELNLTPEMMHLFVPSSFSGNFMHEGVGEERESMPTNQLLQQPSELLQINAANHSEEEPSRNQERVVDSSPMPTRAAKQKKKKFSDATKKSMKKRDVDDDSWMPEGWVKQENPRSSKGKFPGYVDKKYYAPGVRRAFRSKIEALRYIEKMRNAPTDLGQPSDEEKRKKHPANTQEAWDAATGK